jgi:single-strand DNA-binding protein
MLNQIVLVGRIVKDPVIEEMEDKKYCNITLAVPRSYKNENGEYDTDFIPITLWNGIAQNTTEYCKKGDLVGVKGRIQAKENDIEIIAEKLTFLSSKKVDEE